MRPNCSFSEVVTILISAVLDVGLTLFLFGTFLYLSLTQSFGSDFQKAWTGNDCGFNEEGSSSHGVYVFVALMTLYILLDIALILTTLIRNKLLCWSWIVGSTGVSLAFIVGALCLIYLGATILISLWFFCFKIFIIIQVYIFLKENGKGKNVMVAAFKNQRGQDVPYGLSYEYINTV